MQHSLNKTSSKKKKPPLLLEELKYKCRPIFLYLRGHGGSPYWEICSLKREYLKGKGNFSGASLGLTTAFPNTPKQRLAAYFTPAVPSEIKVISTESDCLRLWITQRIFISIRDLKARMRDKAEVSGPYWWFKEKMYLALWSQNSPENIGYEIIPLGMAN